MAQCMMGTPVLEKLSNFIMLIFTLSFLHDLIEFYYRIYFFNSCLN